MPLVVVAVKRYCVAALIVETFLDPVTNPLIPHHFKWNEGAKQSLAARLTELPTDVLKAFNAAYRACDPALLRGALTRIRNSLCHQLEFDLANLFVGCSEKIAQIASGARRGREIFADEPNGSLNFPVFVRFAQIADALGASSGYRHGVLVHDKTLEYESSFRWVFDIFRNWQLGQFRLPNGALMSFEYKSLESFLTVPSHSEPLIQAADRVAGIVRLYSTQALLEKKISPAVAQIATHVLPLALLDERVSVFIGLEMFGEEFFEPIRTEILGRTRLLAS